MFQLLFQQIYLVVERDLTSIKYNYFFLQKYYSFRPKYDIHFESLFGNMLCIRFCPNTFKYVLVGKLTCALFNTET